MSPCRLGNGTYGTVYSATSSPSSEGGQSERVAIKRNFTDTTSVGSGNIRELDMLVRMKGHPFIVELKSVSYEINFADPEDTRAQLREDKLSFILEFVPETLDRFICSPNVTLDSIKMAMMQILLAVEFMHARYILHRDLKPANILVERHSPNGLRIRLCDFGMSSVNLGPPSKAHNVTTTWYRAPEACTHNPYSYGLDVWSIGCIFFEMITGVPLFSGEDDADKVFELIYHYLDVTPPWAHVREMFKSHSIFIGNAPAKRLTFAERIMMYPRAHGPTLKANGELTTFCDLLRKLLAFRPEDRITISDALRHPFFKSCQPYVDEFHRVYPARSPELPSVQIVDYPERRWMMEVVKTVVAQRETIDWFDWRIIFHAIDIFDRHLEWCSKNRPQHDVTEDHGLFFDRQTTELHAYVCLYIYHKYFIDDTYARSWEMFFPAKFVDATYIPIGENFENIVLQYVTQYRLYRDTLYEVPYMEKQENPDSTIVDPIQLFEAFSLLTQWDNGNVRAIYHTIID